MVSCPCALVMPSRCAGSTAHCARAGSIRVARSAARVLAQEIADRQLREAGIPDVAEQVRVRQLLGLDHHVQRPRAVEAVLAERETFHQVEHHQHRDALPLRRNLAHRPPAVGRLDWVHPLRLEIRQIGLGHRAAGVVQHLDDRSGRASLVEAIAPVGGRNQPQRRREVRVAEHVARGRRPAVREERLACVRIRREHAHRCRTPPPARRDLGHREPLVA